MGIKVIEAKTGVVHNVFAAMEARSKLGYVDSGGQPVVAVVGGEPVLHNGLDQRNRSSRVFAGRSWA